MLSLSVRAVSGLIPSEAKWDILEVRSSGLRSLKPDKAAASSRCTGHVIPSLNKRPLGRPSAYMGCLAKKKFYFQELIMFKVCIVHDQYV